MHRIAIVAFDGVVPFDLSVPIEVFGRARPAGGPGYSIRVCADAGEVQAGLITIRAPHDLRTLAEADTVVVPGVSDIDAPIPPRLRTALAAAPGRLVSICTGAFILAAAGLLDGRRATTHWAAAPELARRHPAVEVDPVLTSAGAAAGLDLCLHLVRHDHGAAVAAQTARSSVMPLERAGGQAQFIAHEPPAPDGVSLQPLLTWLSDNLDAPLTLSGMAARVSMSTRSLSRHFRDQTGTTPMQWLTRQRVRRAQHLLETTDRPVEQVGELAGFTSPTAFRERFRQVVGVSPREYRSNFAAVGR